MTRILTCGRQAGSGPTLHQAGKANTVQTCLVLVPKSQPLPTPVTLTASEMTLMKIHKDSVMWTFKT